MATLGSAVGRSGSLSIMEAVPLEMLAYILSLAVKGDSVTTASCKLVSKDWRDLTRLSSTKLVIQGDDAVPKIIRPNVSLKRALDKNPQIVELALHIDSRGEYWDDGEEEWGVNWDRIRILCALPVRAWTEVTLHLSDDAETCSFSRLLAASKDTLRKLHMDIELFLLMDLEVVLRELRQLTHLTVRGLGSLEPRSLLAILDTAGRSPLLNVRELDVDEFAWYDPPDGVMHPTRGQSFAKLQQVFPNLENLTVRGSGKGITRDDYVALLGGLPRLRNLVIEGESLAVVDNTVLQTLAQKCPLLEALVLARKGVRNVHLLGEEDDGMGTRLTAAGIASLLGSCSSLRNLKLSNLPVIGDEDWAPLLLKMRSLEYFEGPFPCRSAIKSFAILSNLRELAFVQDQEVQQQDLISISKVARLLPKCTKLRVVAPGLNPATAEAVRIQLPGVGIPNA
ncbi:hypothetical protein KFL_000240515 [Klebsormidium nitens]|uniref:F-box domain-containing protein n=1 Tax=Klebsormidium nitens TaxID=105231 RepID=A0A1Y1HKK7_KLENI|nr:hypothetical protein KFL_000240515 [Klebsormidium nitens]|eukprot:GAQ79120.1 hypothetical protein KFL_000240515 [Klebsormidium nitens]